MVVFVGDKPSKKNKDARIPFVGTKSYKTLLEWIYRLDVDINRVKLVNQDNLHYCYINSLLIYNGNKICLLKAETKVIALGIKASEKLSKLNVSHFSLPHPSGLNRKTNNKNYMQTVLKECKNYVRS